MRSMKIRSAVVSILAVTAVAACSDSASKSPVAPTMAEMDMAQNAQGGAPKGYTDGWFDGSTVKFFYTKDFFCAQPPSSGAPSNCEVGDDATVAPRPGNNIPTLYVMVPLGITVPQSTLQCPVAGSCIDHPSTIDLSRLFGAGAASAPLPPHSHIIDEKQGGWWDVEVIGVSSLDAWNQIVAAKSLTKVRQLQAAGTGVTGDIPSNLYLFFNVQQ